MEEKTNKETIEELKKQILNKRVTIVGDHPHAGFSGETYGIEKTAIGKWMIMVNLDNGLNAGVFNSSNLKFHT